MMADIFKVPDMTIPPPTCHYVYTDLVMST